VNASIAVSDVAERRTFLVAALRLDALASGAMGVLLATVGPWLDGILGASAELLVPLGLALVGYAGGLWLLARTGAESIAAVKAVITGNAVWVVASVMVVLLDVLTLTGLGTALVLLQAAAVALLADLQVVGLRRLRA
jgi:hypothetical protein